MNYFKKIFKPVAAERADVVADLLIKLVGETVQSKLIRAILVGFITAGAQYSKEPAAPAAQATLIVQPRQQPQPNP